MSSLSLIFSFFLSMIEEMKFVSIEFISLQCFMKRKLGFFISHLLIYQFMLGMKSTLGSKLVIMIVKLFFDIDAVVVSTIFIRVKLFGTGGDYIYP